MVNPRRTNAVEIYQDDAYFSDEKYYYDYCGNKKAYQKGFRTKLRLIKKYAPHGGKLLDIGAAYGFFMEESRRFDFEPFGVELSPRAAKYASQYGEVFTGTLAAFNPDIRFSVVTFIDSLEHFEDPVRGLEKAYSLLVSGGIVAVMVPNIESLFARIMGSRWHLLLPEEHLFYFSHQSVVRMLSKVGFEIVHFGTGGYGRSMEELARVIFRGSADSNLRITSFLKRFSLEINLGDIFFIARKVD